MTRSKFRRIVVAVMFCFVGLSLLAGSIPSLAASAVRGQIAPATSSILPPHLTATPPSAHVPQTEPLLVENPAAQTVRDQVIVKFAPDVSADERAAYLGEFGGSVVQKIDSLDAVVVSLPPQAAVRALTDPSLVQWAEPNFYVTALEGSAPNDPRYPEQWALPAIGAPEAWARLPANARAVLVAVVDSGVCADHPDLTGRVGEGWDFVEEDAVPQDAFGHGCAVAGVIAANMNDEIGIAGVAPNARLMPLRVLDESGVGTYSDVAAAIVHATDNGADIVNLSLGGSNPSSVLEAAVDYATARGVLVVAAAGNNGTEGALYPAAYQSVVAVGSVDPDLQPSSFSNYGQDIDLWAPGRDILATTADGAYRLVSGTSFAAPHVAAYSALETAQGHPSLSTWSLVPSDQSGSSEGPKEPTSPPPITPSPTNPTATPFPDAVAWQNAETPYLGMDFRYPGDWSIQQLPYKDFGFRISSPQFEPDALGRPNAGAYLTASTDPMSPEAWQDFLSEEAGTLTTISGNDTLRVMTVSRDRVRYAEWFFYANGRQHTITFASSLDDYEALLPVATEIALGVKLTGTYEPEPVPAGTQITSLSVPTPLLYPFQVGEGRILADYNAGTHVTGGQDYGLDMCEGTDCEESIFNQMVLAPTDITLVHSTHGYGMPTSSKDYHFFEISPDYGGRKLCLVMGHLQITLGGFIQGKRIPRQTQFGRIINYSPSINHIHMALFTVPAGQLCAGSSRSAVPFDGTRSDLGGLSLGGDNYHLGSNYVGRKITSSNAPMCAQPTAFATADEMVGPMATAAGVGCDNGGLTPDSDDTTAPIGSFTSPANGSTISDRTVTVSVSASDNAGGSGVKEVRFSAKWSGEWHGIGTDSSAPYSINWDLCNSGVPDGEVELGMEIWDKAGNVFIWSRDGGNNPRITKNYVCTGGGSTQPGGSWDTWAWMNKYLAGYDNWHGYYSWDNGNWPYIAFDWGSGAPFDGWPSDEFSFRLQRDVYFPGGDYHFEAYSDDGVKLYVDGDIVLNNWWDGSGNRPGATRTLSAGNHQVRVEYYENGGDAFLSAWWYGPGYPRPDNNPPDGRLTTPANGAAVNTTPLTIAADAWDDASGVDRVVFSAWTCQSSCAWRDLGTDTSAPYSISWDWSALSDQHVWIKIHVYDKTGKSRDGAGGWVELDLDRGKPAVTLDSPTDGETLSANLIPIEASAGDSLSGIDRVQFFVGYADTASTSSQAQPPAALPSPLDPAASSKVTASAYWHEVGTDANGADGWIFTWDAGSILDQDGVAFYVYAFDKAGNYASDVVWNTTLDRTPSVEVTSVAITDENGFSATAAAGPQQAGAEVGASSVKSQFSADDPIQLWIVTDNQFATDQVASFEWLVTDPAGQTVPELSWAGELTTRPDVSRWYLSGSIPSEALTGDYTFSGSITYGGERTSKFTTFSVDGLNSVVLLDVFTADNTGAPASTAIEPQQVAAGDATSSAIQTSFNAGDPIELHFDVYNNVAENEVATFRWAVYDPWDRKIDELGWYGNVASYYGRSEWWLNGTIPDNVITGAYIFVGSIVHNGRETTDSAIFHVEGSPGPPNDDFDAATTVTGIPFTDVMDTWGATVAADDPEPACGSAAPESSSVWYRFTPPGDAILTVDTAGSDYDTVLALWTGNRGNLTAVGCNDDADGTPQSRVSVSITPGTTYYIEVAAYSSTSAAGMLNLTVELAAPLSPPGLVSPADGHTTSDNAPAFTWNAGSGAGEYRLQVDDNPDFSNPTVDTTTSNTSLAPSTPLPDDTYYWRVRAGDGAGNWSSYSGAWELTVDTTTVGVFSIYLPGVLKQ